MEYARQMREKAAHAERAMRILAADAGSPDDTVGCHAQQAVEKLLKTLLNTLRVRYERTHELRNLLDLLSARGVMIPIHIEESCRLQPYAARLRSPASEVEQPLDREWAIRCVRATAQWVDAHLDPAASDDAAPPASG